MMVNLRPISAHILFNRILNILIYTICYFILKVIGLSTMLIKCLARQFHI